MDESLMANRTEEGTMSKTRDIWVLAHGWEYEGYEITEAFESEAEALRACELRESDHPDEYWTVIRVPLNPAP
jgi:hypothetical protein